jgi:hypothetical protein
MALGSMVGAQWYDISGARECTGGWDVELLYATGIDQVNDPNGRAKVGGRAARARSLGLLVLVRVDHAPRQALPPTGSEAARTAYVLFLQSICQDAVYRDNVFGYIIGNEPNLRVENEQLNWAAGQRLTPEWYARIFIGFGLDPGDTGNAHSSIKTFQPNAWVLVGGAAPWSGESSSDAADRWVRDKPWLNYFHAMCRRIASVGQTIGRWPDAFAIHAYGRTGLPGSDGFSRDEPHLDVPFGTNGAQGGFRVYRDWAAIIDATGFDPAVPIFVTETNTLTVAPSSQSYPSGWYTEALRELRAAGPRYHALCWFVDNDPSGAGRPSASRTPRLIACRPTTTSTRRSPRSLALLSRPPTRVHSTACQPERSAAGCRSSLPRGRRTPASGRAGRSRG